MAAPVGLDATRRATLERIVIRARVLLEDDLAAQTEGRFGIHLDGAIEDEATLPDNTTDKVTRRELVEIVAHLRMQGEDGPDSVARLLREAAFTHLNRLIAIRIAETIGLLPESLARGSQSQGFKDLGEIMPVLADDYRAYLRLCGDELAADAPALFDPRNPLLALEPSTAAFDALVALLSDTAANEVWSAPDTLGWAYQFFNTREERREMREASAPRNSRELAVRNQFFTPRYVVDFLVQNTIGRRLIENDPASPLLDEMPLLVDPPTEPGPALDLEDVKCLDPACGSGHFLLGCYDLLERAWEIAGVAPSESAPKIVASLWGVDIDVRCAQVASAAVILRARRHCRDLALPRPNIVTARGLPGGADELPLDSEITDGQRDLVDRVGAVLADVPLLGVLLKAEETLEREVRHGTFEGKAGTIEVADEAAEATERELLSQLQTIADRASSSVAERLLAAEANDALRFVQLVRQRYDAVLMNPPFGEPVPETKPYLRAAYPWLPTKDSNLLAAFVGRGLELCRPDGYLGAITSRAGMFLTTFEDWRRHVLLGNRLTALTDLGNGVMDQAMVEAAAYTIGPGQSSAGDLSTFIRLLREPDRGTGMVVAVQADRAGLVDPRVYKVGTSDLYAIPGAPIAYWMAPSVRRLFTDFPKLEGNGAEARQGLASGDDFRFVRAFWEVNPERIAQSVQETYEGKRWSPFAKGGEYSPYWADIHLLVNYEDNGRQLRDSGRAVIRNSSYYFRSGLTWPLRTQGGFNPRILPSGCVFGHKGPSLFADNKDEALTALGWLLSRPAIALLESTATFGSYEVGLVQRLPWPGETLPDQALEEIRESTREMAARRADGDHTVETTRRFCRPRMPETGDSIGQTALKHYARHYRDVVASNSNASAVEDALAEALGLGSDALTYLDEEVGPRPATYSGAPLSDEAAFAAAFTQQAPINSDGDDNGETSPVTARVFVADRSFETLAHALRRHPSVLQRAQEQGELLPPGEPRQLGDDILSYLVGVAFGRWDLRIGRDPSLAPALPELFDPVPLCSPGMLVGSDGMPAKEAPAGYPIELPPMRLLVDEPGHQWDVEASVFRAAAVLFDDPSSITTELLQIFRRKSVRDCLRKQFFKDHLSRYSKSRRKAPIYWPLTVPSKDWGVWVYAPTFTRETLFEVANEAKRRERLADEIISRLQREQHEGGTGRSARRVVEEFDKEEKLAEELRQFRTEAERIAGLGWEPDLDDGIILCAAPLADLFPSWPDAKRARTDLRNGKYEWATVAAWADQI